MLKRDYIQRLIEESAEVLARLLGFREAGLYHEAQNLLDESIAGLLGLNNDLIRQTSPESIIPWLREQTVFEPPHYTALAYYLREQAEVSYAQGKWEEGDHALRQALAIYHDLNDSQPEVYDFERYDAISQIEKRLSEDREE